MVDKHASCPNCGKKWDGGDALENLSKLDVFFNKSKKEMDKVAAMMGYSEHNKSRFTRVIVHEKEEVVLLECPYCNHLFNAETAEEYASMMDFNSGKGYVKTVTESMSFDLDDNTFEIDEPVKPKDNGKGKEYKRSNLFYKPRYRRW